MTAELFDTRERGGYGDLLPGSAWSPGSGRPFRPACVPARPPDIPNGYPKTSDGIVVSALCSQIARRGRNRLGENEDEENRTDAT